MEATKFIWFDGDLIPWDQATVHVLSHGLHYGTGVFEGIRVYDTPKGSAVFRLADHMRRLVGSAKAFRIPLRWSVEDLCAAARDLVRANGLPAVYLRPIVFLGTGSLGLNPAGAGVHTAIGSWVWGAYLGAEGVEKGIRARVSSWRRVGHEAMVPNAKGTGQYVNSVLAKQEAIAGGYDEALLLNTAGYVVEGSGENLFLVRDGVVSTPTTSMGALAGITRDTLMTLLRDEGYDVSETAVTRADLYYADEAFFTGTAAEVTPIREIDDRAVGSGGVGPVTRRAQEMFRAVVTGALEPYAHWLDYV
ncbi:MAG: branched chain amino acid aminotransferase [Actinobacteria bacterium RBG_16_68_21]|nr:MAG: branched chain amino acid aminotransferase [Actinobacteria bacterium RBG_16_68_21]